MRKLLLSLAREIMLAQIHGSLELPMRLNVALVKRLLKYQRPIVPLSLVKPHMPGCVNGLYATTAGVGGITKIEIAKVLGDAAKVPDRQGKVMQESMQVARSVAFAFCNITGSIIASTSTVPRAARPRTAPAQVCHHACSYFAHQTDTHQSYTGLYGEIDLQGEVTQIGGLYEKAVGAITGRPGIFFPRQNLPDWERVCYYPELDGLRRTPSIP